MRLFTYGYSHSVQEIQGSNPSSGTMVGGIFHPARQLARFSQPIMPYILNIFRISLREEAINYRPYASPSFEIASHVKKLPFWLLLYVNMYAI